MPSGPEANNPIYRALTPNPFPREPGNTLKDAHNPISFEFISTLHFQLNMHARHYNLTPSAEINMTEAKHNTSGVPQPHGEALAESAHSML